MEPEPLLIEGFRVHMYSSIIVNKVWINKCYFESGGGVNAFSWSTPEEKYAGIR